MLQNNFIILFRMYKFYFLYYLANYIITFIAVSKITSSIYKNFSNFRTMTFINKNLLISQKSEI